MTLFVASGRLGAARVARKGELKRFAEIDRLRAAEPLDIARHDIVGAKPGPAWGAPSKARLVYKAAVAALAVARDAH